MKILYEIGEIEIVIDTVGAKLEYIKRNGKEILNNCRICVPNYGVDKTFRYPTDGLFVDKKYDVISKSEDMCVLRCVDSGIESFVVYQFTNEKIVLDVNVTNNSETFVKMKPAIIFDLCDGDTSVNCDLKKENSAYFFAEFDSQKQNKKFSLPSNEKCKIYSEIRL